MPHASTEQETDEAPALGPVTRAADAMASGHPIVLSDTEAADSPAVLALGCQFATPGEIAALGRHGPDPIRLALTPARAEELGLRSATRANESGARPVLVGAAGGLARVDRGLTVAIDPESAPGDLVEGGPILPVAARPGGVLERAGHAEAAIDMARIAGIVAACALVSLDGPAPEDVPRVSLSDVIAHRMRIERTIRRRVETRLPTRWGEFTAVGYDTALDDRHHLALTLGALRPEDSTLVRVHAERILEDRFGGWGAEGEIGRALAAIGREGRGAFAYVRRDEAVSDGPERAAAAPSATRLLRDVGIGAQILADLGVRRIRIMTDHPRTIVGLAGYGLEVVGFEPLSPPPG